MTSTPSASAASATTPISPTDPPPVTRPMPRRASSAASPRAASAYSGRTPEAEPQKTQTRFTGWRA